MVCPAVEKTRSEGADVEGIHDILLASKANKLNWYWLSRHESNGSLNSANAADLIFLHDSWLLAQVYEAEKDKKRTR